MRPANPVFEDFSTANIMPDLSSENGPMMLALNGDSKSSVGALIQASGRGLKIFSDWVIGGEPIDAARTICQRANFAAQRRCSVVVPNNQFMRGTLAPALRKIGIQTSIAESTDNGRAELRRMLKQKTRALPELLVDASATWTRNGFLQGYSLDTTDGPYKLLFEAIESLCGLVAFDGSNEFPRTNAVTKDGREFFSARAVKHA